MDSFSAVDCGIPLLNISVNCQIDNKTQTCDQEKCISAVGNFFFNSKDYRYTRRLFECCEHEQQCDGLPSHIYSPWQCLGKDPFYSCNQVYEECKTADDEACKTSLRVVEEDCPENLFESDTCLDDQRVTEKCYVHASELQGWYCSCRVDYHEVYNQTTGKYDQNELELTAENITNCLKRKRIFTHNTCLDRAIISPMENTGTLNSTSAVVMGLLLGIFIVITFVYFTYTKLRNISAPPQLHHVDTSSANPSNDTIISTLSKCPTKGRNSAPTPVSCSDDEESKDFLQYHQKAQSHVVSS